MVSFGSVLRDLPFLVSQQLVPMISVELEELSDVLSFYFWLLVWAPRILEGPSIFSKSPCQVHSLSFLIRITLVLLDFNSNQFSTRTRPLWFWGRIHLGN